MMKGDSPKDRMLFKADQRGTISLKRKWNWLLLRKKRRITQRKETNWLRTVAKAAPWTPSLKTKMNKGSKPMFKTAPMRVVAMERRDFPWAVTKELRPWPSKTKTMPKE